MTELPRFDCPADECDGTYVKDVGGRMGEPQMEYRADCIHTVEKCSDCGEVFTTDELAVYSAYNATAYNHTGKVIRWYICPACNSGEWPDIVPEDATEGREPDYGEYGERE